MGPEKCSNNLALLFYFGFCCLLYLTNSTTNGHLLATTGHGNKDAHTVLFRQHKLGCHGNETLKTKHVLQGASWDTRAVSIMSAQTRMESEKNQTDHKGRKTERHESV